jgi:hypothetical protein
MFSVTFEDLLEKIQNIPCSEKRVREPNYYEGVFAQPNMLQVHTALEACFGPPLKPEGKPPTSEATQYSKAYGGVQGNQVLYYRKCPQGDEMAMLWPWGNGASVTLKMIRR